MQMVRAGERMLFVSANGRYVFTGPAWDLWHGPLLPGWTDHHQAGGGCTRRSG
jgi:hypothetical protein